MYVGPAAFHGDRTVVGVRLDEKVSSHYSRHLIFELCATCKPCDTLNTREHSPCLQHFNEVSVDAASWK